MNRIVLALTFISLTGCSSLAGKTFENKVVCSADNLEAMLVSKYGPVGITTSLGEKDSLILCTALSVAKSVPVSASGVAK